MVEITIRKKRKSCLTTIFVWLLLVQTKAQDVFPNTGQWRAPQTLQTLKASPVSLIPFPGHVIWTNEKFVMQRNITILFTESNVKVVANAVRSLKELLLANGVKATEGYLEAGAKKPAQSIVLLLDKAEETKRESYSLQISGSGMLITAGDQAGFYYAVQTLRQMIAQKNNKGEVAGCSIDDAPAFGLRGFMHDNGRNFQSIKMLKNQLDRLSHYKYNTFHWHLTDNPAWRPQSNIYPQLNDPKNRKPGRDPDSSYSFDDIRELIRYARERCITIIPELDMPGHSKYFEPTFGFKMESQEGMKVLENLVDEFCREIPASDCPVLHIGSDEVHIPNPKEFIQRMTACVQKNGRKAMVWNPGLPPVKGTIEQHWRDDGSDNQRSSENPYVDSYGGYLNYVDAFAAVRRYFFQQICNKPAGDSIGLGGIVCCWPDTRVDDKTKILLHNAVWPGAIAYSEAVWCGRPEYEKAYMIALPAAGTEANGHFSEFESRLAKHRLLFFNDQPFPYVASASIEWMMTGPFYRSQSDPVAIAFAPEKKSASVPDSAQSIKVAGGIINFGEVLAGKKFNNTANETVYLTGYIFTDKAKEIHAITGFEAAARSNRRSAGIPENGKWDANGGTIFINHQELQGPVWKNPGGNRYLQATWEKPANEIPFTDEEFYWSRPPAAFSLTKGWNKIVVRAPRTYKDQNWLFAFVPVKKDGRGNWVEDLSIRIKGSQNVR